MNKTIVKIGPVPANEARFIERCFWYMNVTHEMAWGDKDLETKERTYFVKVPKGSEQIFEEQFKEAYTLLSGKD